MSDNNSEVTSQKIASLLIDLLYLPNGYTITTLFGKGNEATDLEAMTLWVESQINEIDTENAVLRLKRIARTRKSCSEVKGGKHVSS